VPVLCVLRYDDEDDAIRIANDSPYGLSGELGPEALLNFLERRSIGIPCRYSVWRHDGTDCVTATQDLAPGNHAA
jgi:hypothetical protein